MANLSYLLNAYEHYHEYVDILGLPVGCSDEKILFTQKQMGLEFPKAYREFLIWMGNDKDGLFRGTDCFLEDLPGNRDGLIDLLEDNKIDYSCPKECVVFYLHQGYIAFWFTLENENNDPICYGYSEGEQMTQPRELGKFSDFMTGLIFEAIDNRIAMLDTKTNAWWKFWK